MSETSSSVGGDDYYAFISDTEDVDQAELELDEALNESVSVVVIDQQELGKAIAAAIRVGNFMHKASVLSGLACLGTGLLSRWLRLNFWGLTLPAGVISVTCALFYDLSWRTDPCCKYQVVDWNGLEFQNIPLERLQSTNPVVLVRRDDTIRKRLHNIVSFSSAVFCGARLFQAVRARK
ncbi:hypothetical protein CAOG_008137 [Capsaspora owczarzaki ATCC 30864]|uniref:Uncharacterized protein n=1 Tax=Capsaspora owczarzaki (strain ATCC 30864) TaxID=595528 RepID=A0A0D2UT50_CAPO3|nr:hypothetical protein CAOG_008137 [Capsaspora owczarzaki ATCC 30864]